MRSVTTVFNDESSLIQLKVLVLHRYYQTMLTNMSESKTFIIKENFLIFCDVAAILVLIVTRECSDQNAPQFLLFPHLFSPHPTTPLDCSLDSTALNVVPFYPIQSKSESQSLWILPFKVPTRVIASTQPVWFLTVGTVRQDVINVMHKNRF